MDIQLTITAAQVTQAISEWFAKKIMKDTVKVRSIRVHGGMEGGFDVELTLDGVADDVAS